MHFEITSMRVVIKKLLTREVYLNCELFPADAFPASES